MLSDTYTITLPPLSCLTCGECLVYFGTLHADCPLCAEREAEEAIEALYLDYGEPVG